MAASSEGAWAGDEFKPKPAPIDQARCKAMGEGFYAVAGSNTCVKISGYIGTGVVFASPVRVTPPIAGPSARHDRWRARHRATHAHWDPRARPALAFLLDRCWAYLWWCDSLFIFYKKQIKIFTKIVNYCKNYQII